MTAARSDIPARLDRLPWSAWHWRVVIALGVSWLLDGLEVTVVGSLSPALQRPETLGLSAGQIGWAASAYIGGAVALWLALDRPALVERLVLECPAGLVSIDKRIKRVNRKLLEHYGADDGKDEALVARVAEVEHFTLILQGVDDGTIPKASAEWLARQLQRASLVLIDQAGHDLEKDQPEPVLAAAREFLNLSR